MTTDNLQSSQGAQPSPPSRSSRSDRSSSGWASDVPVPPAVMPQAVEESVKPRTQKARIRKNTDESGEELAGSKVVTDFGGPVSSAQGVAANAGTGSTGASPVQVAAAKPEDVSSKLSNSDGAEVVFERKGDRPASEWAKDAGPTVSGKGWAMDWTTVAGAGLLTAGLVGRVGGAAASAVASSPVFKIVAMDGLIGGADVYVGTTKVGTTDKTTGALVLSADPGAGVVTIKGGTNLDTGLPNTLVLKSVVGFSKDATIVISPLTTLVAALVDQGLSESAAQTRVKAALGLSASIDLNTFHPTDASNLGTADGLKVQKAGAEIAAIASSNSFADTAFSGLAAYLVSHSAASNLDLSSLGTLQQIYSTSTTTSGLELADVAKANAAIVAAGTSASVTNAQLAQAAPVIVGLNVDSGSNSTDKITNNAQLVVTGLNSSSRVELSVDGGSTWVAQSSFAPADGTYTVLARLHYDNGLNTGNSNAFTFTLNTATPATPQLALYADTGISATDHITSNGTVAVSGHTKGMTLEFSSDNVHWNTYTPVAHEGANDFYVRQTNDLTGTSSAVSKLSFTLDTHADAGTAGLGANAEDSINDSGSSATDGITNNNHPQLAGHTEAGATSVKVTLDGHDYSVTQLNADGSWTLDLPSTVHLTEGSHTPYVTVTDAAGNTSDAVAMPPIVIDTTAPADATGQLASICDSGFSSDDGLTYVTHPIITGHAEAFATVSVDLGLDQPLVTTADKNGNWNVVVNTALDDGDYTPSITVTDKAGNSGAPIDGTMFTVMTTGPGVADRPGLVQDDETIDTGISSNDGVTSNVLPTLTGTLETGSGDITSTLVAVNFAGYTYFTQPDDSGFWTVQIPEGRELEDGTYTAHITYVDPAGNTTKVDSPPVVIDTTPPDTATADLVHDSGSDTGLSYTDGITNNTSPTIEGAADPYSHIAVDMGTGDVFETDADANGKWSVQVSLGDDGDYTPMVTVTDLAGNTSDPIEGTTFTLLTATPDEPTGSLVHDDVNDTGIANDDSITANNRPAFEGTASASSEVTLSFTTADHHVLTFKTVADADGNWSLTLDKPLPDGEYTPVASITDLVGNEAKTELDPIVIDTTPPSAGTVTVSLVHDSDNDTGTSETDGITNNASPTLGGTADANALITVEVAGGVYDTQADEDGNWSITLDSLDDGTYKPVVHVIDSAGNESAAIVGQSFTIDTSAPSDGTAHLVHDAASDTGLNQEDGLTANASPWFEGTAEPLAHVILDLNGTTFETDADAKGYWKLQATDLDDDDYTPLITVLDKAGNQTDPVEGEPFTVSTATPDEPTGSLVHDAFNDTGVADDDSITANHAPSFEGAAAPGAEVLLQFKDATGRVVQSFTTTADADGNWNLELTQNLPDGVYTPVVSITDVYGNVGSSELDALTIDTLAPTALNITAGLTPTPDSDTGDSASDGVTTNNTPNISGHADPFSSIRVDIGGATYLTDADETGNWSVDVDTLADGVWTPQVYVQDAAGNASALINGTSFTIDTAAPQVFTAGVLHNATNDTGVSATDGITSNNKPALSGTTEAFATVTVDFNGQTYSTQADKAGKWTLTPDTPLADGEYVPIIDVTDKAGNLSDSVEGDTVVVDTHLDNISGDLTHDDTNDTGASTDDGITNNNMPSLSGTAEAGSTVRVTVKSQNYTSHVYTTVADEDGNWVVDTTDTLADGTYTASIAVEDLAGNKGSIISAPITIDTVAGLPGGDIGTHMVVLAGNNIDFNPIPAGASSSDVTVEDYSGNLPDGLFIDASGHIVGKATATGMTWLQVTASDLAGNEATQFVQLVVAASEKDASVTSPYSITSITSTVPEKASYYTGSTGADHLNVYASSGDAILGGVGGDLFQMFKPESLGFVRLDGGMGMDQVNFSGTELVFDFSIYNNPDNGGQVIEHIESFYFLGVKSDITVSASDLFHLRSDMLVTESDGAHQTIRFMAGATNGGSVNLDGLTQVGAVDAWGATGLKSTGASNDKYTKFVGVYHDAAGDHLVELLLQHGLHAA